MPLLEVDEAHFSRNLKFEESEGDALKNLFPKQDSSTQHSKVVVPTAGFCLKTTSTGSTKKKVFINVCHTDHIPSPIDISQEDLKNIWSSDEHASYRVPMSIATPRIEFDKHGESCDVYDVAISTMFFKKLEKDLYFRTFLLQIIFEGLANKFGAELSISNGIILKHRKAMGSIQPHRIQMRKLNPPRKLIETVDNSKIPQYILKLVGRELVCRFHLPNIAERDIKLQLGEDRMRIEAPPNYLVDIFIPFLVDCDNAVALFDCQTDTLTVTVPASYPTSNTT